MKCLTVYSIASRHGFQQKHERSDIWANCWRIASRAITSSHLCRPACHLLACLLRWRLVEYREIRDSLENMVSSVDLNGPAEISDSACQFWCLAFQLRARHAPSTTYSTSKQICQWMYTRWKPGKFSIHSFKTRHSLEDEVWHSFRLRQRAIPRSPLRT